MKSKSLGGTFMNSPGRLLLVLLPFSFACYAVCLVAISQGAEENRVLLCGVAALLSLLFPALFYLRSEGGKSISLWGKTVSPFRRLPLLFAGFGGFFAGVFFTSLTSVSGGWSPLLGNTAYSFSSFAAVLVSTVSSVLIPFGLLETHLAQKGSVLALLASALFYAALSFSFSCMPFVFALGLAWGWMRIKSGSLYSIMAGALSLGLGIYVGPLVLRWISFMPALGMLLLTGFCCVSSLVAAFLCMKTTKNDLRHIAYTSKERLGWILFCAMFVALSLVFAPILLKWMG